MIRIRRSHRPILIMIVMIGLRLRARSSGPKPVWDLTSEPLKECSTIPIKRVFNLVDSRLRRVEAAILNPRE